MKLKKYVLSILIISSIFIMNSTIVFSFVARPTYNEVNVVASKIMKLVAIVISLIYIIFFIKLEKKIENEKKLIMWLIITIILVIALWYGAELVFEAGITYTSIPIIDKNLPTIPRN